MLNLQELYDGKEVYRDNVNFDNWGLGFDSCGLQFLDKETYFLPLAESPNASRKEESTIASILVSQTQLIED
jgi:hypothetical protein